MHKFHFLLIPVGHGINLKYQQWLILSMNYLEEYRNQSCYNHIPNHLQNHYPCYCMYLHNHLQYNYAYNAEGRVSAKEVLKWNKENQRFEKQYCLNFSYDGTDINVEYVAWNSKTNAYADVKAKAVYQINAMGTSYQSYKWNKKDNSWNLTAEHSTQAEEIMLFAENNPSIIFFLQYIPHP